MAQKSRQMTRPPDTERPDEWGLLWWEWLLVLGAPAVLAALVRG